LERLLAQHGATATKLDAVTRRLRDAGRLPNGGRGPNAPEIGPEEAAVVLVALAGSGKGLEADLRLEKLETLSCKFEGFGRLGLIQALTMILEDPDVFASIHEVRISRTTRHAAISYLGKAEDVFSESRSRRKSDKFYVEGILPGQLLKVVARSLQQAERAGGSQ
jgi:hypothetical protein